MPVMRQSWARRISVDPTTGCWVWSGYRDKHGYGRVTVNGKSGLLHRYMWTVVIGPIPERTHLHHRCERPSCCNPQHLAAIPVTEHRRIHDYSGISAAWERRRKIDRCKHGHPYTPENTRLKTDKRGYTHRACRTCERLNRRINP